MNGKIIFKLVAALVLVAAIGGIAFFAYQAGVAQGSPITIKAPSGETLQQPYPYYGHGTPYHHPAGLGFGCFGILIPLFLFFVAMKAFRFMFWGSHFGHHPMMMHGHGHGRCGRHGEGDVPPMFAEWHKRAHGEKPEEKQE